MASEDRAAGLQQAAADWARQAYIEVQNAAGDDPIRMAELLFEQAEIASQVSQKLVRAGLIALVPRRQLRPKG